MKKILLVTDGIFHPPLFGRWEVHRTLAGLEGFTFTHINSLEKLPGHIQDCAAVVVYLHHKVLSEGALSALDRFVADGGGLLGVHSATASYKDAAPFFKIIGGQFVGHGPVEPFEMQPVAGENAPFEGIGSFTIKDELYIHDLQPGIHPHFTAIHSGQAVPVVWTYLYGQGRVCYLVPGHRTESMKHPAVQAILQRGLAWVTEA